MNICEIDNIAAAFKKSKPEGDRAASQLQLRQWIRDMWEVGMALFPHDVVMRVEWAECCGWEKGVDGGARREVQR